MALSRPHTTASDKAGLRRFRGGAPPNGAKGEIRILLLEDSPTDLELVRHALRKGGVAFSLEHVDNKSAFIQRIEQGAPDPSSDFSLPSLDGYVAWLSHGKRPDVPFILTGTLGEVSRSKR
jgi:hypothetical protein